MVFITNRFRLEIEKQNNNNVRSSSSKKWRLFAHKLDALHETLIVWNTLEQTEISFSTCARVFLRASPKHRNAHNTIL